MNTILKKSINFIQNFETFFCSNKAKKNFEFLHTELFNYSLKIFGAVKQAYQRQKRKETNLKREVKN